MTILDPIMAAAALAFILPGGILALFSSKLEELAPAILCAGPGVFMLTAAVRVQL